MKAPKYKSGDLVEVGDRVKYHDEPGEIEFVVTVPTGDASLDWYAEEYPGGGFMLVAKRFGRVFVATGDEDEELEFVSRHDAQT